MDQYVIYGDLADVEHGSVISDGAVFIKGEKIEYAGQKDLAPDAKGYEEIHADGMILPGFIDCHAHLIGFTKGYMTEAEAVLALKAAGDMKDLLRAGFTAVRDMSRISPYLKRAVESGWIEGPRISAGSQVMSPTSGHVDEVLYRHDVAADSPLSCLCDGVEGCLKATRMQFRRGAEFIKICATGGVSSMADGLDDVQYDEQEVKAIVREAQRHGSYVAAHCSGVEGTKQALKCGVRTVEHGIQLDDECVELMKAKDCSLVTTLYVSLNVGKMKGLPEWLLEKGRKCAALNRRSIEKAHRAGINIALGTDFGNEGSEGHTDFSFIGKEFEAITQCGFSNMEALQIGTINAAKCMRREHEIGSLSEGKYADIVICSGNPIEDIRCITTSDQIRFVMKGGRIIKNS